MTVAGMEGVEPSSRLADGSVLREVPRKMNPAERQAARQLIQSPQRTVATIQKEGTESMMERTQVRHTANPLTSACCLDLLDMDKTDRPRWSRLRQRRQHRRHRLRPFHGAG